MRINYLPVDLEKNTFEDRLFFQLLQKSERQQNNKQFRKENFELLLFLP